MPALPSPGQVLRITFKTGDGASIEAGSRFFVTYGPSGTVPNGTDLNTLATDVANAWEAHLANSVSTEESLHGVEIVDLSSSSGAEGVWTGTKAGLNSAASLVASACAVVNHQISRRYRGGRPRTYVRMGTTSDLTGTNQWNGTFLSGALTNWEAFIAAVLATSGLSITLGDIVNVSFYEGFTTFTTPSGRVRNIPTVRATPKIDNITGSAIAVKLGSQRRRLNL